MRGLESGSPAAEVSTALPSSNVHSETGTGETIMADGWAGAAAKADVAEGKVPGIKLSLLATSRTYHLPGGVFCATDTFAHS